MSENQNHWLISESGQSILGPSQDIVPGREERIKSQNV